MRCGFLKAPHRSSDLPAAVLAARLGCATTAAVLVLSDLTSLASSWVGYLAKKYLATPAPSSCGYRTWGQQEDASVSSEMDI